MPDIDPWASYNPPQAQDQESDPWASYNPPNIELTDEKLKKQLAGGNIQATQDALTGRLNTGPIYTVPEEYTRPLGALESFAQSGLRGLERLARTPGDYVRAVENVPSQGDYYAKIAREIAPQEVQDEANAAAVRPDVNPATLGIANSIGDAIKAPGDYVAGKLESLAPKGIPSSSVIGNVEIPTGQYGAALGGAASGLADIAGKIAVARGLGISNPATTTFATDAAVEAMANGQDPVRAAAAGGMTGEAFEALRPLSTPWRVGGGAAMFGVPSAAAGASPVEVATNALIGAGFGAGDAESPQDAAIRRATETARRAGVQLDPLLESIAGRQFGSEYGAPLTDADVASGVAWSKLSPLDRLAAISRPAPYQGPAVNLNVPSATPQSIQAERDALVNGTARVEDLRQNVPQTATAAEAGRSRSALYKTYQDLLDKGMSRSSAGRIAFGDDWENRLADLERSLQPGEAQPELVHEEPKTPDTYVRGVRAVDSAEAFQKTPVESAGANQEPVGPIAAIPGGVSHKTTHGVTVVPGGDGSFTINYHDGNGNVLGTLDGRRASGGGFYIDDVSVHPNAQRAGIATRLVEEASNAVGGKAQASGVLSDQGQPFIESLLAKRPDLVDAKSFNEQIAKMKAIDKANGIVPGQVGATEPVQNVGTSGQAPTVSIAPSEHPPAPRPAQNIGNQEQVPRVGAVPAGPPPASPANEAALSPNPAVSPTGETPKFNPGDTAYVQFNRKSGPVVEPRTISQVVDGIPYWRDTSSGEHIPIKPERVVKVEPRSSAATTSSIDVGADTDARAREWVKSAIERGEEIPPDVLALYPDLAKEVGEEPAAVGGVGPGTKRAGESEDPREQIQQLTQTLDNMKSEMRPKPSVPDVQGQTLAERGAAARKAVSTAAANIYRTYTGHPEYTEADKAMGKWLGSQARSGIMSYEFSQAIKKAIPDKITREAMAIWIESHPTVRTGPDGRASVEGDADLIKYWRDNGARAQDPSLGAAYQRALELTPDEKTFALNVKNYFDAVLDQAKKAGVLDKGIEDYVTHVWKVRQGEQSQVGGLLGGVNPTKGRILPTWAQGEDLGYRGDKDIGALVVAYQQAIGRKIANSQLIDSLLKSKAQDGKPLAVKSESRPPFYEPSTAPGFNGVYLHPEIAKRLNNATGISGIRQSTVGKALLDFERGIKETMVAVSPFHPVQLTVHAAEHRVNLFDLREPSLSDPDYSALLDHSYVPLGGNPRGEFKEGLGSGAGVFKYIPKLGNKIEQYQSWMWDVAGRLKANMALDALARNRERYSGKLSEDQILHLTAIQANAAFGGQNMEFLGRNRTMADAIRLLTFAPDFLESRMKFAGQALKGYGAEQRQALLGGAAAMYLTARIVNAALNHGDPKMDPKDMFSIVVGGRSFSLRSVQGDILHLVTDPNSFILNRLSPMLARPLYEILSRRDIYDRRTTLPETLGTTMMGATPIAVQDALRGGVRELMGKNQGAAPGFAESIAKSFLQNFGVQMRRDFSPAELKLKQYAADMAPSGGYSKKTIQAARTRGELMGRLKKANELKASGDMAGYQKELAAVAGAVRTAKERGWITDDDIGKVKSEWNLDPLVKSFKDGRLDFDKKLDVWSSASKEQRAILKETMREALANEIEKHPNQRDDLLARVAEASK